jgi:hypothetical protein
MRYPITAVAALIVAAVAVTGVLSGCTSAAPTATPTATAPPADSPLDVPTSVPNVPTERANVQVSNCASSSGGWSARGTASNPGSASKTYTITVFFTTSTGTVVGVAATHVTVAKGKTARWATVAQIPTANDLSCVLRGVG